MYPHAVTCVGSAEENLKAEHSAGCVEDGGANSSETKDDPAPIRRTETSRESRGQRGQHIAVSGPGERALPGAGIRSPLRQPAARRQKDLGCGVSDSGDGGSHRGFMGAPARNARAGEVGGCAQEVWPGMLVCAAVDRLNALSELVKKSLRAASSPKAWCMERSDEAYRVDKREAKAG